LLINQNGSEIIRLAIPAAKWKLHEQRLWNKIHFARSLYHNEIGLHQIPRVQMILCIAFKGRNRVRTNMIWKKIMTSSRGGGMKNGEPPKAK
jgi:hypothetical protein